MKRRILCFGDSNTWGFDGKKGGRFDEDVRWTGLLQKALGPEYTVIEEGQNSRTILAEDPILGDKTGGRYILPCLESQRPLDLLILMLGTNDLKARFNLTAYNIGQAMDTFLRRVRSLTDYDPLLQEMKILLLSPPPLGEGILTAPGCENFRGETGLRHSRALAAEYAPLAEKYRCVFLDAGQFAAAAPPDYLHLDAENHARLARALEKAVPAILEETDVPPLL